MSLSQHILLRLKKAYEKYAFRDVIRLNGGRDLVVFEFRDTLFEAEMRRRGFAFELRPSLHPRKDLYMGPAIKMSRKRLYRNFDLSPSVTTKHVVVKESGKQSVVKAESPATKKVVVNRKPVEKVLFKVKGAEIDNSF